MGVLMLAVVLSFGLAACGSKPSRVADAGRVASVPTTGVSGGATPRRGGGYYKDDGPDDVLPPNLDLIPDAVPAVEPLHRPAFRPYTVMGQHFVPRTELAPFKERGHASWYGRRFHGNPTSIGEPYDMYAMTAAHPTLPIPSYARVTNLSNGQSVIVRVNDRGPFLRGRVIDLSYAAAHRLGYINSGSAHVEVESITHQDIQVARAAGIPALPGAAMGVSVAASAPMVQPLPAAASVPAPMPASAPAPAPVVMHMAALPPVAADAQPVRVVTDTHAAQRQLPQDAPPLVTSGDQEAGAYLQLGAFATPSNAEGLANRVRSELAVFADRLQLLDEGGRYRLQLGPFASADDARVEAGRIGVLLNLQPFVVIR